MGKLEREIIICVGQTGMGKTVWSKTFLRGQKRTVILDPQSEYNYQEFFNAEEIFNYISSRKIFRVKCCDLREFSRLCFAVSLIPKTLLVIEESQRVLAPRLKIPIDFEDIIYRGRHTETSLLLIAQRATTIDIAVRSQFSQLVVFRQTEKHDLDWVSQVSGYDINDSIKSLSMLEYFHITNTGIEKKKLLKFY